MAIYYGVGPRFGKHGISKISEFTASHVHRFPSMVITRSRSMPSISISGTSGPYAEIKTLCNQRRLNKAMELLLSFDSSSVGHPPEDILLSLLKLCKDFKYLGQARKIFDLMKQYNCFEPSNLLCDSLVHALVTCGGVDDIYEVVLKPPFASLSAWNAVIGDYSDTGQYHKALKVYKCMLDANVEMNSYIFVRLLKGSGSVSDLEMGRLLHADAEGRGFGKQLYVGSSLISMYGKCRSIPDAENVFIRLESRNVVSWNGMLSSYVDQNQEAKALRLYRQMLEVGVTGNHLTLVAVLQACIKLGICLSADELVKKSILQEIGQTLHSDARRKGVVSNAFVGSTLVNMYSKLGCIKQTENVFSGLIEHNMVSWNVMLSAYIEHGTPEKTLLLHRKMQEESIVPDHHTFMISLEACLELSQQEENATFTRELTKALQIDVWRIGFSTDAVVASRLITVYSKCGSIEEAEAVFSQLVEPDVVAWNAMLSLYVKHNEEENAIRLYRQMQEEGVRSDEMTFVFILQACRNFSGKEEIYVNGQSAKAIALDIGRAIHSTARRTCCILDPYLYNTVISLYGKCGTMVEVQNVFSTLKYRDIVSWNAMLSANVEQREELSALHLYIQMQRNGVSPDKLSIATALQACANALDRESMNGNKLVYLQFAQTVHNDVYLMGFDLDNFVRSTLVNAYCKCGNLSEAENVFLSASNQDIVLSNVMLSGYMEQYQDETGLQLFSLMLYYHLYVDARSFTIAIKACSFPYGEQFPVKNGQLTTEAYLEIGHALHADAYKKGFGSNDFVTSSLVAMYSSHGCIEKAEHVFAQMTERNVVLWNVMLMSYVEQGEGVKTLQLYREMLNKCIYPDQRTWIHVLQACCIIAQGEKTVTVEGRHIKLISLLIGHGLHEDFVCKAENIEDVYICGILIRMYAMCHAISEAEVTFDSFKNTGISAWNAMLSAYVDHNQHDRAVGLYKQMLLECVSIDTMTILYVLQACSGTCDIDVCMQLHFISISVCGNSNSALQTSVIQAYCSCASILDAIAVFDGLCQPDVAAWSTCITGHGGRLGDYYASYTYLNEMHLHSITADEVTYCSFLNSCSHSGLVDKGIECFKFMIRYCGINPELRHYACIIDLLGRAGNFSKLECILRNLSGKDNSTLWLTLLGACYMHANLEMAEMAFVSALSLEDNGYGSYHMIKSVYKQFN